MPHPFRSISMPQRTVAVVQPRLFVQTSLVHVAVAVTDEDRPTSVAIQTTVRPSSLDGGVALFFSVATRIDPVHLVATKRPVPNVTVWVDVPALAMQDERTRLDFW